MKRISGLLGLIVLSSVASPAFAQLGSGSAPPTTTQPDKFPSLTWTQSSSCVPASSCSNNIYRGVTAGGAKGKINSAPVTTQPYRDTTAAFGTQNFYTITAVRTSDNAESLQSAEVSATATQGSPSAPSGVNVVVAILIKVGKGIIFAITFGRVNLFG
jgi:hypothetical protein